MMDRDGRTLVVGLAGHVDHGKTSLVRALTGTDTDRLEEERRRGLTIELGFAHTRLPSGLSVSFVDVPGHERFVRTMASGVSGIDAALLVVDARESVRAQTREHADILRILGVRRVLGVVTKSDLVDGDQIRSVEEDVSSLLGPMLHGVVACSAKTGDGLDALRDALSAIPVKGQESLDEAPFRMPVDRVFSMHGSGTVVTGTVWQGEIGVGDTLGFAPGGGPARVRGIQSRGEPVDSVRAGQRAAINVAVDGDAPVRGHELVTQRCFIATRRLTVDFELLRSSERPLRSGARVLVMLGTRAEPASMKLVDRKLLEPGDRGLVQLIFAAEVVAAGGQALLVRAGSPETTIGGGVVRSVFAPGLAGSDDEWHQKLRLLGEAAPSERLQAAAWMLGERSWDEALVHQEAGVWDESTPGVDFASGRIEQTRLDRLLERVMSRIESLSDGAAVARSRIVSAIPGREAADVSAAIDLLVSRQLLVEGPSGVSLAESEAHVAPEDRAALERLREIYDAHGATPPPADDVAKTLPVRLNEARRLIKLASERGVLVHVSGGLFMSSSVSAVIQKRVRALLQERGRVTVGDVRELLGITRKHAVPICEYLDRIRVTQRIGNERVLYEEEVAGGA